jgi:MoxR-like ATPase
VTGEPTVRTAHPPWTDQPDARDGSVYELSANLGLAVEVALAIRRPLLLRGEPGTGKSSLAPYLARTKQLRYYEHVVTAQTLASDLLWSFDTVRRLGDAQIRTPGVKLDDFDYIEPGPLWWALAPQSAARRGKPAGQPVTRPCVEPFAEINAGRQGNGAVVLIDEIDKADPDMPNGLLVPLGSEEFTVVDTGTVVRQEWSGRGSRPVHLVVITTNEERELPQAFLRRCVVAVLPVPKAPALVTIAKQHLARYVSSFDEPDTKLIGAVADALSTARDEAKGRGVRPPGTAEFLDALRACWNLGITLDSQEWRDLREMVLLKPHQQPTTDE